MAGRRPWLVVEAATGDPITLRPAAPGDAAAVARLVLLAGSGLFEFMFDGLAPGVGPLEVLTDVAKQDDSLFSHRRCRLAVVGGAAVGLVNAYPADLIRGETFARLPADRRRHLAPFTQVQDWGSHYISALAVDPGHQGQGLGRRLLAAAVAEAAAAGRPRASLHVWDDNAVAGALYRAAGFRRVARLDVPWHPRLPHRGGLWLMSRPVGGGGR